MRLMQGLAVMLAFTCLAVGNARAADTLILAADERLDASGLLAFLAPRFALKHGVRIEIAAAPADTLAASVGGADVVIGPDAVTAVLRDAGAGESMRAAFYVEGSADENYAVMALAASVLPDKAEAFVDWLTSEVGQRTIVSFEKPGQPVYQPGALKVERVVAPVLEGDADQGEKLAHFHCGRCHVISDRNRFGGIGSTPSFPALRAIPSWRDKFEAFWTLNPHPSFTQVVDITPPFDPDRPPHIAPVVITQEDLEAIVAYAASIEPKDLGAAVESR